MLEPALGPFAHSLPGRPVDWWEPLGRHLTEAAEGAGVHAAPFGWAEVARVAGRLHDIGKASAEFQDYIRGGSAAGPDHASAGAVKAAAAYRLPLGRVLSLLIAGHHSGLADPDTLVRRLAKKLPDVTGWEDHAGSLPPQASLAPDGPPQRPHSFGPAFSQSFLVRMLFSCLVDADFLATERFLHPDRPARGIPVAVAELQKRLNNALRPLRARASESALNAIRSEILDYAKGKAAKSPGLFTLTVPTGGGKTLAALAFALDHAVRHRLRRVVVVIPFTAIIEQTAQIYREALGVPGAVLEHHAGFDWERMPAGRWRR